MAAGSGIPSDPLRYQRFDDKVMAGTVVMLLLLVQLVQGWGQAGAALAHRR